MIRYLALVFLIRFGFGTPYRDSEGLVVDGTRHGVYNLKVELDGKEDGLYYGKNEEKYRGKEVNSHGEYNGQSDGKSHGEYGGQSNGNKGYNGRSDGKDHGGHNRRKDREGDNKKMVYQQFYQFDQSPFKDMKEYEMCDGSYKEEYRQVYCKGPLLEAVNHLRIYNDSKDYVDSVLKQAPAIIIAEFQKRFGDEPDVSQIDRSDLQKFIDEFFSPPESELDNCEPEDWTERPTNILKIQDANLRDWALNLNGLWKTLCRRVKTTVFADKERHSLIPVNQPFIVPGGRFREFYYWDTYWIIKGLLVSGMQTSSRYMLKNMLQMVEQFGFVPNGGRAYYTRRSHPPTLIPAVYEYYQASGDRSFVNSSLSLLEKEFNFWAEQRSKAFQIDGDTVRAYFYESPTNVPRPESFLADYEVAINMKEEDRPFFFKAAASAAESGWDFSSRWFRDDQTLQSMETQNIAPVDLNAFLCYNMDILGYLFEVTGYSGKADEYQRKFDRFRKTFEKIFYNETEGAWYDYNIRTEAHNLRVYPSIAVPLFTGCYNRLDESKSVKLFDKLGESKFLSFPGGIPASVNNATNQQWDFPNGWSPLNHMVIEGLRKSNDPIMQDKGFEIATKWIQGNFKVYNKTKDMFEKYNVGGDVPEPGHGGEYKVQTGFGWSNGVVLDLLHTYYDRIEVPVTETKSANEMNVVIPALTLINLFYQLV